MGISGLIPFLEKASNKFNVKDIRGQCVAIDTYCWLHKGAFACADKLARGEQTDIHIQYCLKYVNMLLALDIKPILVFDGRHLPAKALTEAKRRETRDVSKKRAAELLRLGKTEEAKSFLRRCVDITHEMALQLIQECRKRNIDCIVAPYEADAQLAYLNLKNIAQYVITEDSDLVLFGCNRILFKLDLAGSCLLVESEKLYLAMGCRVEKYSFDKFRHMCILSGCDYLDSLPGIGLAKACKFMLKTEESDIKKALSKIPAYLNMRNLVVTDEYKTSFEKADATFKHMIVYDPTIRHLVRLNNPEEFGTDPELCSNAGSFIEDDVAFQLALGNINPFSFKQLDNWSPDDMSFQMTGGKTSGWGQKSVAKHPSIWKSDYKINKMRQSDIRDIQVVKTKIKKVDNCPKNYLPDHVDEEASEKIVMGDILSCYGIKTRDESPPKKRLCLEDDLEKTPTNTKRNPFAIKQNSSFTVQEEDELMSPTQLSQSNTSLVKNVCPVKRNEFDLNKTRSPVKKPEAKLANKCTKLKTVSSSVDRKVISRFFGSGSVKIEPTTPTKHMAEEVLETKAKYENNIMEATSIYLNSPEATNLDRGERTPKKVRPTEDDNYYQPSTGCLERRMSEDDDVIEISSSQKENDESPSSKLDIFKKKEPTRLEAKPVIASKSKTTCRRLGMTKAKAGKSDSSGLAQSKLSMFGFQKKVQLK